jgi:hypothetical protein
MYVYVLLFYQINLNGRCSDVSAIFVRFLFSVFTYWCIPTYHVANCIRVYSRESIYGERVQLKCDGTRWRTGEGEVKGKLANGVCSQYPSLTRNLVYPALLPLLRTPRLPVVDWTDAPADLNGFVRFVERQNLVSARVPSHFKRSLQPTYP